MFHDKDLCPGRNLIIKIDEIFREQSDATRRDIRAYSPRLERAMNSVKQVAPVSVEVERNESALGPSASHYRNGLPSAGCPRVALP